MGAPVKTILSLCDFSGIWSAPYEDAGYDVRRVDLQRSGQDARLLEFIDRPVYGILAAPPCTVFASSGARWPRTEEEMLAALGVVDACLRAVAVYNPHFWALENPVGKLTRYLGKPRAYFHPCEFGGYAPDPSAEGYTKKTALWGRFNLPRPRPVPALLGSKMHTDFGGRSLRAKNARSKTPEGFALAFFEANL